MRKAIYRAHNPKVRGSNPLPATKGIKGLQRCKPFFIDGKPLCIGYDLQSLVWKGLYEVVRVIFSEIFYPSSNTFFRRVRKAIMILLTTEHVLQPSHLFRIDLFDEMSVPIESRLDRCLS